MVKTVETQVNLPWKLNVCFARTISPSQGDFSHVYLYYTTEKLILNRVSILIDEVFHATIHFVVHNLFWTMSNFFLRSSNKRNWIFCLLADDFSLSMSMSASMVLVLLAEILIDHLVALSHSVSLKSSWKKRAAMWFKRFKTCVRLDRM